MVLLPEGSVSELRQMAARQQQQIEAHRQLLVAKEQRLRFLRQQESGEGERLRGLRDRVQLQELKLRRLRALRGHVEQQRAANAGLGAELESVRALFAQKEKELSAAVAKVEQLTRQLEEVRASNTRKQQTQQPAELDRLRRELLQRSRLNEQQNARIAQQREALSRRQSEMARIDARIAELQQRLQRKRAQQLRRPSATVEPLVRQHPKYQTLPHNTKFQDNKLRPKTLPPTVMTQTTVQKPTVPPKPLPPPRQKPATVDQALSLLKGDVREIEEPEKNGESPKEEDQEEVETSKGGGAALRRVKKGNLKTKGSTKILRRVSFDPLALLLDAALEGELELVKKTAKEVPNPSAANDEGITALHNAICAGHLEIVKFLVEFGCDVNAQDSDGWTPLHCAASCNNLAMVRYLVERGACIFATTLSDHETAAEKCEEDEEGFDGCSEYLYSMQDKLGQLNGGIVYALYDYEGQNADELSFHDGDQLTVVRKGDDLEKEWWWTKRQDGTEGYVPRNLLGLHPRVVVKKDQ